MRHDGLKFTKSHCPKCRRPDVDTWMPWHARLTAHDAASSYHQWWVPNSLLLSYDYIRDFSPDFWVLHLASGDDLDCRLFLHSIATCSSTTVWVFWPRHLLVWDCSRHAWVHGFSDIAAVPRSARSVIYFHLQTFGQDDVRKNCFPTSRLRNPI